MLNTRLYLLSLKEVNWKASLETLNRGRTSKNIQKLNQADIHNAYHLVWILPRTVESIPPARAFENIEEEFLFQGHGKVIGAAFRPNFYRQGKGRAMLYTGTITIQDQFSSETIQLRWFNCYPNQKNIFESYYKNKEAIYFLGKPSTYKNQLQFVSPEIKTDPFDDTLAAQAKYPTVNTVPGNYISRLIQKIPLSWWDKLTEQAPAQLINESNSTSLKEAFMILHGLKEVDQDEYKQARKRLVLEEFYLEQLNLFRRRKHKPIIPESVITGSLEERFRSIFPYQLTLGQEQTIQEIIQDLNSTSPMMRLIQGDVGCGKTTVAAIATFLVATNGHQSALMCPTESLARQHYKTLAPLYSQLGIECDLLVGSHSTKEKNTINEKLATGFTKVVIGTHALFQKSVTFGSLKLAIIDEQHKFGVDQRIALCEKGVGVNTLIMTATPIPRSLCMTHFGDLEISIIPELPSDRKGVQTRIVEEKNFEKFLAFIKARINMGEQAYIVVPAIEESENANLMYLEKVLKRFQVFFPNDNVQGVHGQLSAEEKDVALQVFYQGKCKILVATSVIEVGINNPNASVMAIMNPERFGLSSLHQLRGRVGRGDRPGFCFLLCDANTPAASIKKLKILEKTSSGFDIAEEDLRLRGHGDLFGKQQSGNVSNYRIADIIKDMEILYQVKDYFERNDVILDQRPSVSTSNQRVTTTI